MTEVLILKGEDPARKLARLAATLSTAKAWRVSVEEHKRRRSDQQNRFLWLTYEKILRAGGEELRGWSREDLHSFFLGNHFGWETVTGFGRKRQRPIRRSSKLSTVEFMEFVASIQQFMAERGVYLPDPNEVEA